MLNNGITEKAVNKVLKERAGDLMSNVADPSVSFDDAVKKMPPVEQAAVYEIMSMIP